MNECKICNKQYSKSLLLSIHIKNDHNSQIKDYYDKYYKKENDGICKTCNNPTNFICLTWGYAKYCSKKCVANNKEIIEKRIRVLKDQCKSGIIQQKRKESYKHKTGYDNPSQNPEVKQQKIDTNRRVRNVDNPFQDTNIKKQIKQTSDKKYGGIGFSSKIITSKIDNTIKIKYNIDHYSKLNKCKEQVRNTCQQRYHKDNVFQIESVKQHIRDLKIPLISCWQPEYWINKGYSIEESKKIISERAKRDINYFIKKYGEQEGLQKFNDMISKRKFSFSLEGFISRFGIKEGTNKYQKFILGKITNNGISKQSQLFFDRLDTHIKQNFLKYTLSREYSIDSYLIDNYFLEKKCIIEYYGDYWHANPKLNMIFINDQETQKIRNCDKVRTEYLLDKTEIVSKIIIVWESAFIKKETECYSQIINFLNNENDKFLELNI